MGGTEEGSRVVGYDGSVGRSNHQGEEKEGERGGWGDKTRESVINSKNQVIDWAAASSGKNGGCGRGNQALGAAGPLAARGVRDSAARPQLWNSRVTEHGQRWPEDWLRWAEPESGSL